MDFRPDEHKKLYSRGRNPEIEGATVAATPTRWRCRTCYLCNPMDLEKCQGFPERRCDGLRSNGEVIEGDL